MSGRLALGLTLVPLALTGHALQMARPITADQLATWRAEAEALDALAERGTERRAHVAVMDVSVVLALLDEVDRLKEAFVPRPR
jgi:hypothetical protein